MVGLACGVAISSCGFDYDWGFAGGCVLIYVLKVIEVHESTEKHGSQEQSLILYGFRRDMVGRFSVM